MGGYINPVTGSAPGASVNANPAAGGAPQMSVSGSGSEVTKYMENLQNLLGTQGSNLLVQGAGQTGAGITAANPALQFLTNLVSGDKTALESATQPEVDQIKAQFDQIRQLIASGPRGGGTASAMVQAPTEEVKQIADVKASMQKGAAGELGTLATTLAGLGISMEGLGLGAESTAASTDVALRGQQTQAGMASDQMWGQIVSSIGGAVGKIIGAKIGAGGGG